MLNGDVTGGDVDDNWSDEMSALPDKTSSSQHIDDIAQLPQPADSPLNDLPPLNSAGLLIAS